MKDSSRTTVFYGNANFSLFHQNVHLLCDPWFEAPSVAGAFEKFPPSSLRLTDIPKPNLIYISHIHSDHCEYDTLRALDKTTPVLILQRDPPYLERMVRQHGFTDIRLIPAHTPTQIAPGFIVETFGAGYPHVCGEVIDSSAVFHWTDWTVFNGNDNAPLPPFCEDVHQRYPQIDLAFLSCAGGGAYPAMYENLSLEEQAAFVEVVKQRKRAIFSQAIDILQPRVVVPVAGGYALRGQPPSVNWRQCRWLNLEEVTASHRTHGTHQPVLVPMQPGMVLEDSVVTKGVYHAWTHAECEAEFERLAQLPILQTLTTTRPVLSLQRLVEIARTRLWVQQEKIGLTPDYTIYLDINSLPHLLEMTLKNSYVSLCPRKGFPLTRPYLKMTLSQDTMLEWLLGLEDFNMLDSGHRIRFFRDPNTYVQEVYYLMSFLRL